MSRRFLVLLLLTLAIAWDASAQNLSESSANSSCPIDPALGRIAPACHQWGVKGLWRGIGGELIDPADTLDRDADAQPLEVPGYWDAPALGLEDHRGVVTLWADLQLDHAAQAESFSFFPGRFQAASRIYLLHTSGRVHKIYDNLSEFIPEGDAALPNVPDQWIAGRLHFGGPISVGEVNTGDRLVIQLFNNDYRLGGAAQAPILGPVEAVHRQQFSRWVFHALFVGACVLVAIYCLALISFSNQKRGLHVFLLLMSLVTASRLLVMGGLLEQMLPSMDADDFFYCSWMTFLSLVGVFVGCQIAILPDLFDRYRPLKYGFVAILLLPAVVLVLLPWLSLQQFLLVGHFMRVVFVLFGLGFSTFLLIYMLRGYRQLWLEFIGIIAIAVGGATDAYVYIQNRDPYIELFSVGMLFFVVSQVSRLGYEYVVTLRREQELTGTLKELNESLEEKVIRRTEQLEATNARLAALAETDSLTRLPNRRAFDKRLEEELARSGRFGQQTTLAIVDVDWFKRVNDTYGHRFGDSVLITLGQLLTQRIRITDFAARIGGEEFAIILSHSSAQEAQKLLDELRLFIHDVCFIEQPEYRIGLSVGCASTDGHESSDEIYHKADQALYQAKQSGRGKVVVFDSEPELEPEL